MSRGLWAEGPPREALEIAALSIFREDFAGRILSFDTDAAVIYAELFARRRSAGRPAAIADLINCLNRPRTAPASSRAIREISRAVAWRRSIHGRLRDKR